jgi:hypothetical protein
MHRVGFDGVPVTELPAGLVRESMQLKSGNDCERALLHLSFVVTCSQVWSIDDFVGGLQGSRTANGGAG